MRHLILRLAAVLWLIAGPAAAAGKPLVILISMDGFRADYLDRGITPNLSRLAADGARGAVRPSFPSKTYPNHYTLVTGLRPDRHGLVDNVMVDPLIPGVTFRLSDRTTVKDSRWWSDATPLWVTAERQGVIAASVFWPGSETAIQGAQPTYWLTFDQEVSAEARVDQVLAWLDLPVERRPGFISLYFDETDTAGHHDGPDSNGLNAAVAHTDAAIGRLTAGLAARSLAADLMITADHGRGPRVRSLCPGDGRGVRGPRAQHPARGDAAHRGQCRCLSVGGAVAELDGGEDRREAVGPEAGA